jgi:uncharacterized membrane protein
MSATDTTGATPAELLWAAWRGRVFAGLAVAVCLTVPAAFFESFHGLIEWCQGNGLGGVYAWFAPAMVDVFILAGETVLLLAIMESWDWPAKAAGWAAIGAGLAVSVAGNVGRSGWHVPLERMATFAVAPLALAGLTALFLLVAKRLMHPRVRDRVDANEDLVIALLRYRDHAEAGTVPTFAEVMADLNCGQPRARRIRACLPVLTPVLATLNGTVHP